MVYPSRRISRHIGIVGRGSLSGVDHQRLACGEWSVPSDRKSRPTGSKFPDPSSPVGFSQWQFFDFLCDGVFGSTLKRKKAETTIPLSRGVYTVLVYSSHKEGSS